MTNVLASLVTAAGFSLLLYGEPDPRALMYFSVFVITAEMFVYLRWRAALTCRMCGFDPLVYQRSPATANRQVRDFFDRMGEDPQLMLSKSPLVDLHRRQREGLRKKREIEGVRARARAMTAGPAGTAVIDVEKNENSRHHSDLQRA